MVVDKVRHVGMVVGSFLYHLIIIGLSLSFGILISELHVEFGVSQSRAAWVASLFTGLIGIAGVPVSWFVTRYSERKVAVLGSLVLTSGMLASTFVETFDWFYVTYGIVGGLGASISLLPSNTIVMKAFQTNRQLVIAIVSSGAAIGNLVLPPLLSHMISEYGWRGTFLLLGGIGLQCLPAGLLFVSDGARKKQQGDASVDKSDRNSFKSSTYAIIHNPRFVLYTISAVLCFLVVFAPGIFLPDLMKELSMSDQEIYITLMAMGTGHLVGTLSPGVLDTMFGVDLLTMNCVVLLVCAASTLLVFAVGSLFMFLLMAVLLGMMSGAFLSLNVALVAHYLDREHNDVGFGWICTLEGAAVVLGMPLAGWIIDITHTVRTGFLFIGGVLFLSLVVSVVLKIFIVHRDRRKNTTARSQHTDLEQTICVNVRNENIHNEIYEIDKKGIVKTAVIGSQDFNVSNIDKNVINGDMQSDEYKKRSTTAYTPDTDKSTSSIDVNIVEDLRNGENKTPSNKLMLTLETKEPNLANTGHEPIMNTCDQKQNNTDEHTSEINENDLSKTTQDFSVFNINFGYED